VPGPDPRRVGELLADSDALARETLLDVLADQGPAMVRGWSRLVHEASRLWAVLPAARLPGEVDAFPLFREVSRGIGRSLTAGQWPGPGPGDERLLQITDNLSRAARLAQQLTQDPKLTAAEMSKDARVIRASVMRTLYIAGHGTSLALIQYNKALQDELATHVHRRRPHSERPAVPDVKDVLAMTHRFAILEQLAAPYVTTRPIAGPARSPAGGAFRAMRLESALAVWDVQAHRTLAAQPDPADLVRVARVQALLVTTTGIVTDAAARAGQLESGVSDRVSQALEATQVAWSRAAQRWSELTSPASRTNPRLVDAAREVRASVAATTQAGRGWASPDQIAQRVDLLQAVKAVHLSLITSTDTAYLTREIAATHPALTAPARAIAMRAQGEAELAIEEDVTRYDGLTWVTSQEAAANRLVPLPDPARRGLVKSANDVIAASHQAASAAASLIPSGPRQVNRQPLDVASRRIPWPGDLGISCTSPEGPQR